MQMRTYIFPSLLCLFLASCGNNHYNPPLSPKVSVSDEEVAYDSYMMESPQGNETFQKIHENTFVEVANQPVSTFSVDVDRASL
jgi:lipoprotein